MSLYIFRWFKIIDYGMATWGFSKTLLLSGHSKISLVWSPLNQSEDHHSILCMISYEILKTHSFQKEQKFVKLQFEPSDLFYLVITLFPVCYAPKSMFQAGLFNLVNIRLFSSWGGRRYWLIVQLDSLIHGFRYFDYLFYIDFEASMADPRAQNALGHLQVCS